MNIRMTLTAAALASLTLAGCGTTASTPMAPTMVADPDPLTPVTAPGKLIGDPLLQNQDVLTEEVRTGG